MAIDLSRFFPQSAPVMNPTYTGMEQWLQTPEGAQAAAEQQAQYDMQDVNREGSNEAYSWWEKQQYANDFGLDAGSGGRFGSLYGDYRKLGVMQGADTFLTKLVNNTNPDFPTLSMIPERKQQILQQIAQSPEQQPNFLQFLTPEEMQPVQTWLTYAEQNRGHDGMAKGLMAAGLAGFGALAGPSLFGAGAGEAGAVADAAWGVNPQSIGAAGDFSLAGGTAGNAAGAGGLSSSAGGVTGLTAGGGGLGLTVPAATTAMSSGALLTPLMAASAGIPMAAGSGLLGAGSTLSAAQAMGGVGGAPAVTAGGGSALGNILGGTATAADWLSAGGTVGSSLLGLAGANNAADGYGDIANQFMQMGAPYRSLLEKSYAPDFSMANQPDFMNALDLGAQAAARATSARSGNPIDNPGAYAEMEKWISGNLALPQLNTYRSQLGSFGQLGTNTAGTAMGNQVQAEGGMYDALGSGLASLTKPKNPYEDMFKGLMGGFKLNTGNFL